MGRGVQSTGEAVFLTSIQVEGGGGSLALGNVPQWRREGRASREVYRENHFIFKGGASFVRIFSFFERRRGPTYKARAYEKKFLSPKIQRLPLLKKRYPTLFRGERIQGGERPGEEFIYFYRRVFISRNAV